MGQTTVTITFQVLQSSSLVDPISAGKRGRAIRPHIVGRRPLPAHDSSADVTFAGGTDHLSGDDSGNAANYVSPDDTLGNVQLGLFRLFGDANGDGIMDQLDLAKSEPANNTSEYGSDGIGSAEFAYYYDADNSGTIDQIDLAQFRERNNSSVFDL